MRTRAGATYIDMPYALTNIVRAWTGAGLRSTTSSDRVPLGPISRRPSPTALVNKETHLVNLESPHCLGEEARGDNI